MNTRGGPGWWMDVDGVWRAPEEWPEDTPPLPGWQRDADGRWEAPTKATTSEPASTRWVRPTRDDDISIEQPIRSSSTLLRGNGEAPAPSVAQSNTRAMLLVTGLIGAGLVLLVVALILINQAGAAAPSEPASGVSFSLDSIADVRAARSEAALERPGAAWDKLAQLGEPVESLDIPVYDPGLWPDPVQGCDGPVVVAFNDRASRPIVWGDQRRCEMESGEWIDRYSGATTTNPSHLSAVPLIDPLLVHQSGGWQWDASTRHAFQNDLLPAATTLVTANSGHNPRAQGPAQWRPARDEAWCAYAVDWIDVKHRWGLAVSISEREALETMLNTCAAGQSDGADPDTTTLRALPSPEISLQ